MTNRFSVLIAFAILGEDKANMYNRRLLVRLRVPSMDKMVVEVDLEREYLGHCWKLMLICGKIKQTMQGAARVTIQNHHGSYIWIFNPASIHRLVSLTGARDWEDVTCLWVPEDFRIKGCRVLAGMRSTCLFRCVWDRSGSGESWVES